MSSLTQALTGNFVIVNLGAAWDRNYGLSQQLRPTVTLVEVDASTDARTDAQYHKKFAVNKVIAGFAGGRKFRRNTDPGTSSLMDPDERLIAQYDIRNKYVVDRVFDVKCITLPALLQDFGIQSVDYLKTDLEGLDFEVIQSMDQQLENVLCVQCEVRFQPFYVGEPYFFEIASYLDARGFEVISMEPEYWMPKTMHRKQHFDGRVTFADMVWFKKEEKLRALVEAKGPILAAKQGVLAGMLGQKSYGEYILEAFANSMPSDWVRELRKSVTPCKWDFLGKSIMAFIRHVARSSYRRYLYPHLAKGAKDKVYLGGMK